MVLDGAVTAPALVRDAGRKLFLVLDRLPMHRARSVRAWLAERRAEIEVFHLPPYSPKLNPDEGLNADLKPGRHPQGPGPRQAAAQARRGRPHAKAVEVVGAGQELFQHQTFRFAACSKTT